MSQYATYQITTTGKTSDKRVLIIYTGGTFGMQFDDSGTLIPLNFNSFKEFIPEFKRVPVQLTMVARDIPLDSSNIGIEEWNEFAELIYKEYDNYDGFVVLHGTDTMAYTASALSYVFQQLAKPIIFTGAQLPVNEVRSDAKMNLLTAIQIASTALPTKEMQVPEVAIYFDGLLLRANRSSKTESMHFDAFHSANYPTLAHAGVDIHYNTSAIAKPKQNSLIYVNKFDPNVIVLKLFPSITNTYLSAVLNSSPKGIVLETFGAGNTMTTNEVINFISSCREKNILLLNISQCSGGFVKQGHYSTGKHLETLGVISGRDMTTEAGLSKLMFVLANYNSIDEQKALLNKSLAGEITI